MSNARRRRGNPFTALFLVLVFGFAGWRAYAAATLRPFRECAETIHVGQSFSEVEAVFAAHGLSPNEGDPHTWELDYGLLHHAHCTVGVDASGHVHSLELVAGPMLAGCDQAETRQEHPAKCDILDLISP